MDGIIAAAVAPDFRIFGFSDIGMVALRACLLFGHAFLNCKLIGGGVGRMLRGNNVREKEIKFLILMT